MLVIILGISKKKGKKTPEIMQLYFIFKLEPVALRYHSICFTDMPMGRTNKISVFVFIDIIFDGVIKMQFVFLLVC